VGGNRLGAAFAFKKRLGLGLYFPLPLANLDWVDAELLCYLVNCLHPSDRFKTHLGLELRQVCVALLCFTHGLPVSLDSVPLKHLSQIRGPLHYLITLVAHHGLHTELSLRNFLHLVEVNMFEKITLAQMVDNALKDDSFEALKSQVEMF
jgi:hypothetical protein